MNEKKLKIGIFGGSFDPVHYGHLILAEQMKEAARLDRLIFIPTRVNPFKQGIQASSGKHRLEMLRLAVQDSSGFEVSDIEVRNPEVSYTANTMASLQQQYPDAMLYFILGSDAFMKLDTWYKGEELLRNYHFLVGLRKGYDADSAYVKQAEMEQKYGADIQIFDIPELEISSSDIRLRFQAGKSLRYLMPDSVLGYIEKEKLYTGLIEELKAYARQKENDHRYQHTCGVVKAAVAYAKRYGADPFKAEVAAWFHDTYKEAGPLGHGQTCGRFMGTPRRGFYLL